MKARVHGWLCVLGVLVVLSCQPGGPSAGAPPAEGVARPMPSRALTASCIYVDGLVEIGSEGQWRELDIGDAIQAGDTLRTGADASCEIRFGATAVLRLQAGTTVTINEIFLAEASSRVDASLDLGSLLTKVQRLTGNDSYTLRTETIVCGVRGTEFYLSTDPVDGTTLAVRQGRVAVLPNSPSIREINQQAGQSEAAMLALLSIAETATVVEANQELVVDTAAALRSEGLYRRIADEVAVLVAAQLAAPAPAAAGTEPASAPASALDSLPPPLLPFAPTDQARASQDLPEAARQTVSMFGQTLRQELPRLAPASRPLSRQSQQALEELEAVSPVPSPAELVDPVSMVVPGQAPSAQTASETSQAAPETSQTAPASNPTSTPAASTPARPTTTPAATSRPASPPTQAVPPTPLQRSWASLPAAASGRLLQPAGSGLVVTSDSSGTLRALNEAGQLQWTVTTANTSAERSFPVFANGLVYYTGSSELVIVRLADGQVLHRLSLDSQRSHLFGNRLVPYEDVLIYPTRSGIDILSARNAELLRSIPVAGGTNMSPAVYNGQVAIVNQRGVFLLLDIQSGQTRASINTGAVQPLAQAVSIHGDRAAFADRKGLVVHLDLAGQRVLWERLLPDVGGVYTDLIYSDAGIFAYAGDTIFSFDGAGEALLAPIGAVSAPPQVIGQYLVYGTEDSRLVVRSLADGTVRFESSLPAPLSAQVLRIGDSLVGSLSNGRMFQVSLADLRL